MLLKTLKSRVTEKKERIPPWLFGAITMVLLPAVAVALILPMSNVRRLIFLVLSLIGALGAGMLGAFIHQRRANQSSSNSNVSMLGGIIKPPPGSRLLAIAEFLYHPQTVKLTFEGLITDLRFEYNEALKAKNSFKAKYIRVKYFFFFVANIGLSKLWLVVSAIKQVIK